MKKIPLALIYLRILIGAFLFAASFFHLKYYMVIAITLLSIGFLSDVFDGIIARRLNISTEKLRRLDSIADQIFWLLITASLYVECPAFFQANYIQLSILFSIEGLTYIISFIKFKKEVATHAISSKVWVIAMFATLVQVMLTCQSGLLFQLCFYIGIVTRCEIIFILLILKKWVNDVPSIYHAVLLRKGKEIRRNKMFNG